MAKSKTVKLDKDTTSVIIETPDCTVAIYRIGDFIGTQVLVYTDTNKNPDAYVLTKDERTDIMNGTGQFLTPTGPSVGTN